MMRRLTALLRAQRGAMFSMDARIALVIASVLAGVVTTQVMSRIERSRVENTEIGLRVLIDGLRTYYINTGLTTIPTTLANFRTLIIDTGVVPDRTFNQDSWDRDWSYDTCSVARTIEGVPVTLNYAVMYSSGKDGTAASGTADFLPNATCEAAFGAWAPTGDDIGLKFSSLDIDRDRLARYRTQADAIVKALNAYEARMYQQNNLYCSTGANQGNTGCCNVVALPAAQAGYTTGEEGRMNYFPRSSTDATAASANWNNSAGGFYYNAGRCTSVPAAPANTTYTSGTLASMQNLMTLIGMPTAYAQDPWGRVMRYDSNVTGANEAPFQASVFFQ